MVKSSLANKTKQLCENEVGEKITEENAEDIESDKDTTEVLAHNEVEEKPGTSKQEKMDNDSALSMGDGEAPKGKTEPGLIYMSFLPPGMTPKFVRDVFEKYGEVGRIYMQPDVHQKRKGKAKYDRGSFTEGWIEMGDKRLARRLAMTFNNTLITDGKKNKFQNYMWNVKYLPTFRWKHMTERLTHEREKKKQVMRVELSQARRETADYVRLMDKNKKLTSIRQRKERQGAEWKTNASGDGAGGGKSRVRQRKTVEEMRAQKMKRKNLNTDEAPVKKALKSIFG